MVVNALSASCNREGLTLTTLSTNPLTAKDVVNELNNLLSAVKAAKKPLSKQDGLDITNRIKALKSATRDKRVLEQINATENQLSGALSRAR